MTDGSTPDVGDAHSSEFREPTLDEVRKQIHADLLVTALNTLKEAEAAKSDPRIRAAQAEVDLLLYVSDLDYHTSTATDPRVTVFTEIIEGKLPDGRNIKIGKTSTYVPTPRDSRARAHIKTEFTDKMKRHGRSSGQTRMATAEMTELFTRCAPLLNKINVRTRQEQDRQIRDLRNRQMTAKVRGI